MTKVTRKIDDLNRIVLPAEVRSLGWTKNTELDISVHSDGMLLISLHAALCSLCGATDVELIPLLKGNICTNCVQLAQDLLALKNSSAETR